jgi:hypothetical protein
VQIVKNLFLIKLARHILFPDRVPLCSTGHVWPLARTCPGLPYFLQSIGLIQPLCRVLEAFAEYVWPLDQTYPVRPYLAQTMSLLRTYPVGSLGSSSVLRTYPVLGPDLSGLLVLT